MANRLLIFWAPVSFMASIFKVTADTLIPRSDTEALVEAALAKVNLILDPSPQPLSRQRARDLNLPLDSPRPLTGEGARGEGRYNAEDEGQYKHSRPRH